MKNLPLLCACLWALAPPLHAVAGPPDSIVVRIYEGNSITAFITRGAGKSERVECNSGLTDKNMVLASEGYYQLFQRLYQEGYTLQSTITAPPTIIAAYHTLLFVKTQQRARQASSATVACGLHGPPRFFLPPPPRPTLA